MKLHLLKRSKGLKDKQRRLGRGNATGSGNYSGKGLKGQKARSGFSMKAFFEGGQTSIIQRLPKAKGFTRYFKLTKDIAVINLGKLQQDPRVTDDMEITKAKLKELGYIKNADQTVKILGDGTYSKHIKFVDIELFSKSAQEKIAAPGKAQNAPSRTYVAAKDLKKQTVKAKPVKEKAVKIVKAKSVKAVKAEKPAKVEDVKLESTPVKVKAEKVVKEKPVTTDKAPKVVKEKAPKAEKAVKKTTKKETK